MQNQSSTSPNKRIVRLPEVQRMTGLGRSSVYMRLDSRSPYFDASFPCPIELGGRARGWLVAEVEAWIESRPRVRNDQKGGE